MRRRPASSRFGTVDTFLLWRLTGGRVHATDATNASRTQLLTSRVQDWDDDLLRLFNVPRALLPVVHDCAADYGTTDPSLFGAAIPIRGIAGDQQAALRRPGLLSARDGEVDLRHRLLCVAQYRRAPMLLRQSSAHHGCVSRRGGSPMRSKARFSLPERRSSGCGTSSGLIGRADEADQLARAADARPGDLSSCRRSPGSARHGGMHRRGAQSSGSRVTPAAPS